MGHHCYPSNLLLLPALAKEEHRNDWKRIAKLTQLRLYKYIIMCSRISHFGFHIQLQTSMRPVLVHVGLNRNFKVTLSLHVHVS